jgi:hypothetical protein
MHRHYLAGAIGSSPVDRLEAAKYISHEIWSVQASTHSHKLQRTHTHLRKVMFVSQHATTCFQGFHASAIASMPCHSSFRSTCSIPDDRSNASESKFKEILAVEASTHSHVPPEGFVNLSRASHGVPCVSTHREGLHLLAHVIHAPHAHQTLSRVWRVQCTCFSRLQPHKPEALLFFTTVTCPSESPPHQP